MGCGMSLIKYLMFFFNLLVFLSGGALLGVSIWVLVSGDTFKKMVSTDPMIFNSVYIIMAVGAGLFVLGFLGCCGAIKESRCLLGTFFALVLVIFLLQIVGAVLAIVLRPEAEKAAKEAMKRGDKNIVGAWDEVHEEFKCCGIDGPKDWKKVPLSCCEGITDAKACNRTTAYNEGCKGNMGSTFWILAGISFGVLLVEIFAMVFSCLLFRAIGKSQYS